jgi:CAAX protease family protein
MTDNRTNFTLYGKSPLYQLFVSMLIILGIGIFLFSLSLLLGIQIFDSNYSVIENPATLTSKKDIMFLRYVMISQEIALFVIPALIILTLNKPRGSFGLEELKRPQLNDLALVIILAFCIFPLTSFTGQLNSGLLLPDWLSGVQEWMEEKEDNANNMIETLIVSNSLGVLILNLFMIAVLPALGEELIFRGVLQKIAYRLFKSGHLAVWVVAFLFSALHFQFFGFIPRFILGLFFGYLFLWGGTLWLPVLAHFVNNAVPVIGVYIKGWDTMKSIQDICFWKQLIGLTIPLVISLLIMQYFKNNYNRNKELNKTKAKITDI